MNKIRKIRYILCCLLAVGIMGCSDDDNNSIVTGYEGILDNLAASVNATSQELWSTSPLVLDAKRTEAMEKLQDYADKCKADYFSVFLSGYDQTSLNMAKSDSILYFYRTAFERVLDGVKSSTVENGTAQIWLLYNMGYIIKTPSGCFGIDISHRWAEEFAPYLDFLCVTHKHSDHYSNNLIQAMYDLDKPVLSNYLQPVASYPFYSKKSEEYTIGNFKIRTCITNHNEASLKNFVTVFYIDCGDDAGGLTLIHTGDSNFKPVQYADITDANDVNHHVNVLIPRYAPNALTENDIIGTGTGQVTPDYVLLSHVLELSHADEEDSRWTVQSAWERASKINCQQTYVPMWGEKLVWKNGKLN